MWLIKKKDIVKCDYEYNSTIKEAQREREREREREIRETSFDDIPVMFTSANFIRPQIFYFFQQIVLQFFCDIHIFPREIGHIVQVGTALCVFFSSLVAFFFWSAKPSTLFYIYFGVWYLEISSTSRWVL